MTLRQFREKEVAAGGLLLLGLNIGCQSTWKIAARWTISVGRSFSGSKVVTNSGDIILTFGLTPDMTALVNKLIASFAIDSVPLTIATVRNYVKNHPINKVCLVIYNVDPHHPRQARVIQLIRDFVGALVPFLVLLPRQNLGDIRGYLDAGADDYIDLPLNENRFSLSFLILLEMGQALVQRTSGPQGVPPEVPQHAAPRFEPSTWQRVVHFIQEGLNFFEPRSLLHRTRSENISDRWQPVRRLGGGGFGTVWLVQEVGSGRLAVAKTPHSPAMNIGVLRSAAILKRLVHHPNIVQLIEVVKESGLFILIQEYVAGPTLQDLLGRGISGHDKESLFLQLLSVVAYAHQHKIMHRDIKPENIIIATGGKVKLLDFGIARDLSWQAADNSSAGTINFMPPEQFAGRSCIASDVWAIGVILYILATNAVPYCQSNNDFPRDVDTSIDSVPPEMINPGLHPDLSRLIERCLEKDLARRFPSAVELEKELREKFPEFGNGRFLPDVGEC